MPEEPGALHAAREAYRGHDWPRAAEGFLSADRERLSGDDVAALAESHWWLGQIDEYMATAEDGHRQFLAEGRLLDAGKLALDLAINHFLRGDQVLGGAWMARASRILEEQPESATHGYLAYVAEVEANWRKVGSDAVVAAARKVRRIGFDHDDPTLIAVALNGEGRFLVERGQVTEGLRLLDEAMAAVMAGDVVSEWVGNIYCNTIAVCHVLGDIERCRRWTEATQEWLDSLPTAVLFSGICRIYRADVLRLSGDWARAEDEAEQVCRDLVDISVGYVGEGWYEIGEIRRLRGDDEGAEEAYRRAHGCGRDPQPGLALLRWRQGRTELARSSISAALSAVTEPLPRAPLLGAAVEIALSAQRPAQAREFMAELSAIANEYGSPGLMARALNAEATMALGEERYETALAILRDAFRRWRELGAPYEAARACVSLALVYRALGDDGAATRELDLALAEFERLGAKPDLDRVVGLQSGGRSDGLSNRELEVLALVARGRTNKEIGEALFISPKTVARHMSNLFAKLDVSSRTEAARYALERDLG